MSAHAHLDVKNYESTTIMGKMSHITRHLSRRLERPDVSLTVSQAMAAAYSSTNLTRATTHSKKGVKPWVKREKMAAAGPHGIKLRRKLLGLRTFEERNVEFTPEVPPKVGLRLERTMGSPTLKLFDQKYMTKLSEKISKLDQAEFQERIAKRKKVEVMRRRQLVIDGKAEPEHGEESLLFHPVLRCKRIMQRVATANHIDPTVVRGIPVPFHNKVKKLTLVEPFNAYEKTGILFGEHKDHYLRVQRVSGQSTQSDLDEYQSAFRLPSFLTKAPAGRRTQDNTLSTSLSMLDIHGKSQTNLNHPSRHEVPPMGTDLEDADAAIIAISPENPDGPKPSVPEAVSSDLEEKLADTAQKNVPDESEEADNSEVNPISTGELTNASDRSSITYKEAETVEEPQASTAEYGACAVTGRIKGELSMNELEKLYLKVRSKLVSEVFQESEGVAESLFNIGNNVIQAYKREQAKVDDFCKTEHPKLFENSEK